jgi:hypothetical protein
MEPIEEKRIEKLLERYWEGETSLPEEQELQAYFSRDQLPEHLAPHRHSFQFFGGLREERLPQLPHPDRLFRKVEQQEAALPRRGGRSSGLYWSLGLAASVVLMVFGFWLGGHYPSQSPVAGPDSEVVALRQEVQEMKELLLATQRPSASASDRILAVSQEFETESPDDDILQALISTLNTDPNVNVRQAACESLFRFRNEPQVRQALIASLKIQKDPNLQITLIDMLVQMKEKRALPEMNRLIQDRQALDIVRLKAQEGVGVLL